MPAVETIRDIPVIVEHRKNTAPDYETMIIDDDHDYTSGFPFDNSRRSRDPLEDIAQRHPELAQHLQGFPRRSQRGSDQDEDEFLRRRFERPFSSGRFERFGFPFDRDDFEREPQRYYEAYPEYFENFQNQHPQSPSYQQHSSSQTSPNYQTQYSQQYQPSYSQQSQENQQPQYHSQVSQGTQTESELPQETENSAQDQQRSEGGQTRGRPIQQSNTCDLGQSSPDEAVNDRNQRSMSLPPENKRYTSSVNIPMGGHQGQENGSKPQSQSSSSGSTERVIPIHVEGRDDPVIPRNFSTTSSQPQPERIFTDTSRPQPERIFGQRPEQFTQFVNRDPHRFPSDWHQKFERDFPEEDFGFGRAASPNRFGGAKQPQQQSHTHPQYKQFHRQETSPQGQAPPPQQTQPKPPQQTQPKPQPQEQKPSQNEVPQPTKQQAPKQPLGPIEQIQAIQKDVSDLIRQVEIFNGLPRDKHYLYLDEMLTRNLLKLDNVDTQGQDAIRQARKEAIKCIERTIGLLESKAAANAAEQEQKMDVEKPQSSQATEKMETEPSSQEQNNSAIEPFSTSNQQQPEGEKVEEASSQETNKNENVQRSKSGQSMESSQENLKEEDKKGLKCDQQKEEQIKEVENESKELKQESGGVEEKNKDEPKQEPENTENEVKQEKKEKKKIKKKVNKEEKDKQ